MDELPKSQELVKPLLAFLQGMRGPSGNLDISRGVATELGIPKEVLNIIHSGSRTEFEYRLAWARTIAKSKGWISSPSRMVWEITDGGREALIIK